MTDMLKYLSTSRCAGKSSLFSECHPNQFQNLYEFNKHVANDFKNFTCACTNYKM